MAYIAFVCTFVINVGNPFVTSQEGVQRDARPPAGARGVPAQSPFSLQDAGGGPSGVPE